MKLFILDEKYNLKIDPAAYALKQFKEIWDRDKSSNKRQALSELAYIYYMQDYKSDFYEISDLNERSEQIIMNLDFGNKINPDDEVIKEAMEFYAKTSKTKTMLLLEDAYGSIDKLRDYFKNVDLEAVDGNGKLLHDSTKLMNNISKLADLVDGLQKLEFLVRKEQQADGKLRAGREKGMFEDG